MNLYAYLIDLGMLATLRVLLRHEGAGKRVRARHSGAVSKRVKWGERER